MLGSTPEVLRSSSDTPLLLSLQRFLFPHFFYSPAAGLFFSRWINHRTCFRRLPSDSLVGKSINPSQSAIARPVQGQTPRSAGLTCRLCATVEPNKPRLCSHADSFASWHVILNDYSLYRIPDVLTNASSSLMFASPVCSDQARAKDGCSEDNQYDRQAGHRCTKSDLPTVRI